MGAALHLAHAHQAPARQRKPKRTGGGPGDGYDKLVTRLWQDSRQTPESRELLLLLAWLICRDPNKYDEAGDQINTWKRADQILGQSQYKRQRIAELVYADRPRYEMDRTPDLGCQAPMIRRAGLCGASSCDSSFVADPATGQRSLAYFCRRHEAWGAQVQQAWRSGTWPEPVPNLGGLMPSYLRLKTGQEGWARVYQDAALSLRSTWERPAGHSLAADDWTATDTEQAMEKPWLRLAALDGELLATT